MLRQKTLRANTADPGLCCSARCLVFKFITMYQYYYRSRSLSFYLLCANEGLLHQAPNLAFLFDGWCLREEFVQGPLLLASVL